MIATQKEEIMEYSEPDFVAEMTRLQTDVIISKFLLLSMIVIEIILFWIELILLHRYKDKARALKFQPILSEESKRKRFASRYLCQVTIWLCLQSIGFVASYYFNPQQQCLSFGQAPEWDGLVCYNCRQAFCDDCRNDNKVCEKCSEGFYLDEITGQCIDGTCMIDKCEECTTGPFRCTSCEDGFIVDPETQGYCKSSICQIEKCAECPLDLAETACYECI